MGPVVINSAVDSLYCSFDSEVTEGVFSFLEIMQLEAKQNEAPVPVEFDNQKLLVKPYGSRGHSYHLDHEHFLLKVSTSDNMPTLYFQVYASCLYELGNRLAWEKVERMAKYLGVNIDSKTSRIDVCVDFQGWRPSPRRRKDFVTRAKKKRLYFEVDKISGFQFGNGKPIMARIYNKSEEIKVSKKQWMKEVWRESPDYDESEEVWRLEFQFRIDALKDFGALTVDETFDRLRGLFEYGMKWLSLRKPNASRAERSPIDRNWQVLMKTEFPGISCERVPKAKKQASIQALIPAGGGYVTSYAACRGIKDFGFALRLFEKDLRAYHARKETTPEEVVSKKIEQDASYRDNSVAL